MSDNLPASVTTPVYDGATAESRDVQFGWQQFTAAANGLYQLAQAVKAAKGSLESAQETASRDWKGPHKRDFDAKCSTFKTSATNLAQGLESLAGDLANAWRLARGQQGRICAARGFAHRESQESGLNKFGDSLFGDESPNEPADPATPSAPGYYRTDPPPHEEGCDVGNAHGLIDGATIWTSRDGRH